MGHLEKTWWDSIERDMDNFFSVLRACSE